MNEYQNTIVQKSYIQQDDSQNNLLKERCMEYHVEDTTSSIVTLIAVQQDFFSEFVIQFPSLTYTLLFDTKLIDKIIQCFEDPNTQILQNTYALLGDQLWKCDGLSSIPFQVQELFLSSSIKKIQNYQDPQYCYVIANIYWCYIPIYVQYGTNLLGFLSLSIPYMFAIILLDQNDEVLYSNLFGCMGTLVKHYTINDIMQIISQNSIGISQDCLPRIIERWIYWTIVRKCYNNSNIDSDVFNGLELQFALMGLIQWSQMAPTLFFPSSLYKLLDIQQLPPTLLTHVQNILQNVKKGIPDKEWDMFQANIPVERRGILQLWR